ncbi:MAG: dihydrofolate reductase [Prevotellaceae bacterium]|jgi:dihydrofolate reductase|nr:dihydrofolate reductase [Prevotellaceae bacterium]
MKTFSIIVAIAENNAIGKNNDLLWHISDDLKYFKKITSGHTVIMGKNTWLSLPVKPLPERKNIIISQTLNLHGENVFAVRTIQAAIDVCDENSENFIIGGAAVYKQFLPVADRLYITKIHQSFDADVFFPNIDKNKFIVESQSQIFTDEKNGLEYSFIIYKKL